MTIKRTLAACAVGGLMAAAAASPAAGQAPGPCVGYAGEDPAGDQAYGFAGNFTPIPADDTVDLTHMYFRSEGGKVRMFFQLTEGSETPPPGTAGSGIRVLYDQPADLFLDIDVAASGVTYTYGHFGDAGPVSDGETTGQVFTGPGGGFAVDLPASHGGKTGMKLSGTAFSFYVMGAVLGSTDFLPDDPGVWRFNGASCDAGGSAPPPTGGGGTPDPGPGTPPPSQPGGPQPGSPQATPVKRVTVKASPRTLRAKKLKKGKAITFKLTSSEKLTDVTVDFKKGSKALGRGRVASLDPSGKVKIKPRKRVKKGKYTLAVNGRRSDGSVGSAFVKIRVK